MLCRFPRPYPGLLLLSLCTTCLSYSISPCPLTLHPSAECGQGKRAVTLGALFPVSRLWSCQPTLLSSVDLPHSETTVSQDGNALPKETKKMEPSRKELPYGFTQHHWGTSAALSCCWPRKSRPSTCQSWDFINHPHCHKSLVSLHH